MDASSAYVAFTVERYAGCGLVIPASANAAGPSTVDCETSTEQLKAFALARVNVHASPASVGEAGSVTSASKVTSRVSLSPTLARVDEHVLFDDCEIVVASGRR